MLDFQAARWTMSGEVAKQAGNNHPTSIPTGVFQTSDGYMNVAVAGEKIWVRFCAVIGREDLPDNPDYKTDPCALRKPGYSECPYSGRSRDREYGALG